MTDSTKNCRELVDRIGVENDEVLFNQIVSCFGSDLQRFARYRCNNQPEAEDVYQDAMMAAYRYLDSFRGDASLKTWLFKLVTSACMKQRRGKKNDKNIHFSMDASPIEQPDKRSQPADVSLLINEKLTVLNDSMNKLEEIDREMIYLKETDGLSIAELADRTGLSVANVKVRLHRARNQLKEELARRGLKA